MGIFIMVEKDVKVPLFSNHRGIVFISSSFVRYFLNRLNGQTIYILRFDFFLLKIILFNKLLYI
jgi:hypothetical protein